MYDAQTRRPPTMTVLIAGGGIGGLTTAIALQRRGIRALVFEREPELREVGAGLVLAGNAVKALIKIGLVNALITCGSPLRRIEVRSWRGDVLTELPMQEILQRYGATAYSVHRAELQAALARALEPGTLFTGRQVAGYEQEQAGVRLYFTSGEPVWGDVLIGADGLHSAIRTQMVGFAKPRYAGYTAWRGVSACEIDERERDMSYESWGVGRRFGLAPLTQGRIYWFAVANAPEGTVEPDAEQEKRRALDLVSSSRPSPRAVIEATDEARIIRTDIYDRPPINTWSQGRVTLLGDAAHPMTPNLGQGACQAIEDAYVLAESLRGEPSIAAALERYERIRVNRANAMVVRSRQQGQIAQVGLPWALPARDLLLRLAPATMIKWQYEWMVNAPL